MTIARLARFGGRGLGLRGWRGLTTTLERFTQKGEAIRGPAGAVLGYFGVGGEVLGEHFRGRGESEEGGAEGVGGVVDCVFEGGGDGVIGHD